MAKTPFVEIIEKEIPAVPNVTSVNDAVVVVVGTAVTGPTEAVLLQTTDELNRLFVYNGQKTEAVQFAEEIISAGGVVLFKRVIHPSVVLSWT